MIYSDIKCIPSHMKKEVQLRASKQVGIKHFEPVN